MSQYPVVQKLFGINGDGWSTPASTLNACWSALGAGANGLALTLFLTHDGAVVCAPSDDLRESCGKEIKVSSSTLAQVRALDAGFAFRSTELDEDGQPTGARGEDTPWRARPDKKPLKARKAVYFPELREVFELFGRRTEFILMLPDHGYALSDKLIDAALAVLKKFGLLDRATLCGDPQQLQSIRMKYPQARLLADMRGCELDFSLTAAAGVLLNVEQIDIAGLHSIVGGRESESKKFPSLYLASTSMPYALSHGVLDKLRLLDGYIAGYLSHGVLPCAKALRPAALIFHEDFAGDTFNTQYWSAGYSHINDETKIYVKEGLHIDIRKGEVYSGAAAILNLPVDGDFDARVEFEVSDPQQATTFEMAAIGIDPGYHHPDNGNLDTKSVNLTFDVHGAPPYASSERDQNDGFRCGWNNSYNFAKFGDKDSTLKDADWIAASANMYNKYGRDVGDGSDHYLSGQLRLVRSGAVFNTYYRDKQNREWVCSGSMLVSSLPRDAFIRLAAKHWAKVTPPANSVTFRNFSLYQY